MTTTALLDTIQNGVCAVGYLPLPLVEWRKASARLPFQVVGTGFLIRDTVVMTNKHVIDLLSAQSADAEIPEEQLFLSFIIPKAEQNVLNVVRMIRRTQNLQGVPLDVAFIEFKRDPADQFRTVEPLQIVRTWDVSVGQPVCVCGYPYGNKLLEKDGKVERWGPVVQYGHVSALSPFRKVGFPDEILLDVRTSTGMSGSPVFRSDTGEVIGIHHEAAHDHLGVTTTSFALPLRRDLLDQWLQEWHR